MTRSQETNMFTTTARMTATAVVAGTALAITLGATPAQAADGDTAAAPITVSVDGGTFALSAPTGISLHAAPGETAMSAEVAGASVTDARASTTGWAVSASATPLTETTTNATLDGAELSYAVSHVTHTGTVVAEAASDNPVALGAASETLVTGTGVVGNNSAAWDTVVSSILPDDAIAGHYATIITLSVA